MEGKEEDRKFSTILFQTDMCLVKGINMNKKVAFYTLRLQSKSIRNKCNKTKIYKRKLRDSRLRKKSRHIYSKYMYSNKYV